MDFEAVSNQSIAVGLIENPCCWALRDFAKQVPADQAIVELGVFKGRSTGWLAYGSHTGNGAHVFSVDPWESGVVPVGYEVHAPTVVEYVKSETREAWEAHVERVGAQGRVTPIQSTAVEAAAEWSGPKVGLLFHDALHRKEDVEADLRAWLPHLADDAVIVVHDVGDSRLGPEVEAGVRAVFGRRKCWKSREIVPWVKVNPDGTPRQTGRRGYLVLRLS